MRSLIAAALLAAVAVAADPPAPKPVANVTLTTMTVKDGAVVQEVVEYLQQAVTKFVEKEVDGKKVQVAVTETVSVPVVKMVMAKVSDLKATGVDGKAIPADDLEKLLKDGTVVVKHVGKLDAALRKQFKDGTVFMEQKPAGPVVMPPAPPK